MQRFFNLFFNVTTCFIITIVLCSFIILAFGWILGGHSADPDLFTPTLSYFSDLGTFLGGVGTIGLLIISIRTVSSWKKQHKHQHRFNTITQILLAYDELSTVFDEYWILLLLQSSEIKCKENLQKMALSFDERLKEKKVRWKNFSFESIFSNMNLSFENDEINELRNDSELVKGIMSSKISKISGLNQQYFSEQFSNFYPSPSKNMKDVKDLIKQVKQNAVSMVKDS